MAKYTSPQLRAFTKASKGPLKKISDAADLLAELGHVQLAGRVAGVVDHEIRARPQDFGGDDSGE